MAFAAGTTSWFAAAVIGAGSVALADNPVIEDIAPKDTYLVISVPSWPKAKEAFMRSPGGMLWQDKSMQDWIAEIWKSMREDSDPETAELLAELTEKLEEIGEPTGSVGAAWNMVRLPAPADSDDAGAASGPASQLLLIAEYGEGAEKAEAAIVEHLEDQARKHRVKLTPVTVGGIEAHEIEIEAAGDGGDAKPADSDEDMDDMGGFNESDAAGGPDLAAMLGAGGDGKVKVYLARSEGTIVIASQKEGIENALDQLGGANRPHLAQNVEWDAAQAQHPRGGHFFAAVFMNDAVREMMGGASDGMMDMLPIPIGGMGGLDGLSTTLGISQIKAISIGARFDAEAGGGPALEQTFGMLLPEKKGIFTLIEGEGAALEPPTWIGADAASVGRFNVRFERIIPLVESVVKSLPEEMKSFADGAVQFAKVTFGPALEVMGPDVYSVSTIARPLSAKSNASVWAIKVRDELAVANALAGIAAQAGMEPRDFAGAQIYDVPDDSMAFGLGFGWLFVGDSTGVENGMRRAANPGEAGQPLTSNERFRRAVAAANVPGQGIIQTWTDDHQSIDYAIWSARNPAALMRAEYEAMGLDAAEVDDIMEGFEAELPQWLKDMPSADLFKKYLDSSAFSVRSTPEGFRATYVTLPAKAK